MEEVILQTCFFTKEELITQTRKQLINNDLVTTLISHSILRI